MVSVMTTETDNQHGDACDAPDYPSWCDDCRSAYDEQMAAHAQRNALTCSCTTNPTCPDHGDAIPEPTRKEQCDAPFAHDHVMRRAAELKKIWAALREADPYRKPVSAVDARFYAEVADALAVTGRTIIPRNEALLRAAIAEFRNQGERWAQDGYAVDAIADWFEQYANERGM